MPRALRIEYLGAIYYVGRVTSSIPPYFRPAAARVTPVTIVSPSVSP